jgi:uncharacterized protein
LCCHKEVLPKKSLVRIAATKEGVVSIDLKGKAPGRGAYLKFESSCYFTSSKNKALDRKLEVSVPEHIYTELLKLLNDKTIGLAMRAKSYQLELR